jgi:hypothetical protein
LKSIANFRGGVKLVSSTAYRSKKLSFNIRYLQFTFIELTVLVLQSLIYIKKKISKTFSEEEVLSGSCPFKGDEFGLKVFVFSTKIDNS